jgi:beta-lactamase regulating signal transducer with metallopeptidase domain
MSWLAEVRGLGLFLEALIKSTVVLSIALIAAALLRKRSAALRHFILSVSIVGLLLLPALSLFNAGWETGLLPAWVAGPRPFGIAPDAGAGAPAMTLPVSGPEAAPGATGEAGRGSRIEARPPSRAPRLTAGLSLIVSALGPVLIAVWAAGLVLLIVRLALGLAGAFRLSREASPLDGPAWQAILRRFLSMVSVRRKIRLKGHSDVAVPLTWGIVKPVVLMPAESVAWNDEERSSALFHELSHVKRVDFLVMMLVRLSLAFYWFNPLGRLALRRLQKEQEKACDELVLRAGIKPSTYAANLLSLKRSSVVHWSPSVALLGLLGTAGGSPLKDRLVSILRKNPTFKEVHVRTKITLSVIVLFAVVLIGMARPAQQAQEAQVPVKPKAAQLVQPAQQARTAQQPVMAQQTAVPGQAIAAPEKPQQAESAVAAANQEKTVKAEKTAEDKAKDKDENKDRQKKIKAIVIKPAGGKEGVLELVITDGDKTWSLRPGHGIVLEPDSLGKALTMKPDGEKVILKEGKNMVIVVKDGLLTFADEGKAVTIDEGSHLTLRTDESGQEVIVLYEVPGLVIKEEGAPVEKLWFKEVKPEAQAKNYRIIKSGQRPAIATYKLSDDHLKRKLEELRGQLEQLEERKLESEKTLKESAEAAAKVQDEALRARIAELNARLSKQIEADLEDREEALKQTLEQTEKALKDMTWKIEAIGGKMIVEKPQAFTIVKERKKQEMKTEVVVLPEKKGQSIGIISGEGGYEITFHGFWNPDKRANIERAMDKMKKALPKGCELVPEINEEDQTVTVKVQSPKPEKDNIDLIINLIKIFKDEMK